MIPVFYKVEILLLLPSWFLRRPVPPVCGATPSPPAPDLVASLTWEVEEKVNGPAFV